VQGSDIGREIPEIFSSIHPSPPAPIHTQYWYWGGGLPFLSREMYFSGGDCGRVRVEYEGN
jgi:hypothetical protein